MSNETSQLLTSFYIESAAAAQLPELRSAYSHARAIQRWEGANIWPEFSDAAILAEIESGRLYCVMRGDELVGVFSVLYEDEAIWGTLERGRHVYLHRIARASTTRSGGIVGVILEWARAHCRALGRDGLRMDTWASNEALVAFYVRQGFHVVKRHRIGVDPRLPASYHGEEFALLEEDAQSENGSGETSETDG